MLQVKKSKAYKNAEPEARGYFVVTGKVSKKYFMEEEYFDEEKGMED